MCPVRLIHNQNHTHRQNEPSPPMCVCFVITIDCSAIHMHIVKNSNESSGNNKTAIPTGSLWNFKSFTNALNRSFSNVTLWKTGSNSCRAILIFVITVRASCRYGPTIDNSPCPILLTDFCFSLVSFPSESTASSSRKYRLRRKKGQH